MTVHRLTPLPTGVARGRLIVTSEVARHTMAVLANQHHRTVPHEALVWWLGRRIGDDTFVLSSVAPMVESGPQHVFADEAAVGDCSAAARPWRLAIVAQVHSHPGGDTRHSDGDDQLVLMPFEGMFSLVVAHYGAGDIHPNAGAGLHQYQDGCWVWITDAADILLFVPAGLQP